MFRALLAFSLLAQLGLTYGGSCSYRAIRYYQCSTAQLQYYTHTSYTSCGFLWRDRCARNRQASRYGRTYQTCSSYYTAYRCCTGWSGTTCGTHSLPPTVVSCPSNVESRAASLESATRVTWDPVQYTEPHGYPLTTQQAYTNNEGMFPLGVTRVVYVATSSNNNKDATCAFDVTVKPPLPRPQVRSRSPNDIIRVNEGQTIEETCYTEAAASAIPLSWYLDGTLITTGISFSSSASTAAPGYFDSKSVLTLTASRTQDRKSLVCKGTGLSVSTDFTLTFNVHYEVDPDVDFCPTDQTVLTTNTSVSVIWQIPRFSELRDEPLRVTDNIPGSGTSSSFPWGSHVVSYTATNTRSGRSAVCRFTINVEPHSCQTPAPPTNGSLVCGFWPETYMRVCTVMCHETFDVSTAETVFENTLCGASGKWLPPLTSVDCNVPRTGSGAGNLPAEQQYFTGTCGSQTTKSQQETNFMDILRASPLNALGSPGRSNNVEITVTC